MNTLEQYNDIMRSLTSEIKYIVRINCRVCRSITEDKIYKALARAETKINNLKEASDGRG